MSQEFARVLLLAITAVAALVWLAGLVTLLTASRSDLPRLDEDPRYGFDDFPGSPSSNAVVAGSAEVEGEPAVLSRRAAAELARIGSSGMLKITERDDRRLAFEGTGLFPALGMGRRSRVVLDFERLGQGRARVRYRATLARGRALIWLGGLFQLAGLIALVAGFWALNRYVIPSPNLGIRGQVVQMFQVIHFLWPPFLLAYLHRRPKTMLRGQLDALVHNLPHFDADRLHHDRFRHI